MAVQDNVVRTGRSRVISPELVHRIARDARAGPAFYVLMGTSGVLAAVAFLANSVPVLLGAMIVAPALPPLSLVAVGIVAGNRRLLFSGLAVAISGLGVAVLAATLTTGLLNATGAIPGETNLLNRPLLEERVRPGWYSVIAALAAGISGGIALIRRKMDTLVGVVAALALVPAGAAAGIAIMSESPERAAGGLVLLGVNAAVVVGTMTVVIAVARPADRDPGDEE